MQSYTPEQVHYLKQQRQENMSWKTTREQFNTHFGADRSIDSLRSRLYKDTKDSKRINHKSPKALVIPVPEAISEKSGIYRPLSCEHGIRGDACVAGTAQHNMVYIQPPHNNPAAESEDTTHDHLFEGCLGVSDESSSASDGSQSEESSEHTDDDVMSISTQALSSAPRYVF